MAAARAPLRLVPDAPAVITVPQSLLEDAIGNAASLADDLDAGVQAIGQRLFAGSRAAAINELGRMAIRIESFRDEWAALDPRPTQPRRPRRAV